MRALRPAPAPLTVDDRRAVRQHAGPYEVPFDRADHRAAYARAAIASVQRSGARARLSDDGRTLTVTDPA